MRTFLTTTAALAALALGASACSKPAAGSNTASADGANTAAGATADGGNTTPGVANKAVAVAQDSAAAVVGAVGGVAGAATPAMFVDNASQSDMLEIQSAHLALKRSQSPGIKKFAQGMIHAHEKTSAELKKIVEGGQAGDAKLAAHLDNRRQGLVDNLEHASDAEFDARYVDQQAAAHREASELMKTYAKAGTNDALMAFAAKTAPAVDEHLAMVKALDKANADHDAPNGNPNGKASGTP